MKKISTALLLILSTLAVSSKAGNRYTGLLLDNTDSMVYRQVDGYKLKAYIFKPKSTDTKHPAVLLFHGGAWRLGDATWMFQRAKEFADKGMVAIAIDYRLANNGSSPAEGVEDACAAFAWARSNANKLGINTKMVAGYGVSAGGHLVASAALLPAVKGKKIAKDARPDALVLFSPALNQAKDPYFDALMKGHGNPAEYSPSEYITKRLSPTLIIQGEKDNIVFTPDAIAFRDAAVKAGAQCSLYVYPGVGHILTRNIAVQYKDFDGDPVAEKDAHQKEDDFLRSLGYFK